MKLRLTTLKCPACGAVIKQNQQVCEYCRSQLIKVYEKSEGSAIDFQQMLTDGLYNNIIEECKNLLQNYPNDPDLNYYYAISLLQGQKPFLLDRKIIDDCVKHLDRSIKYGSKAIFYFLRAYIEYDYFERKFLNRDPDYKYYLEKAEENGITKEDIICLNLYFENKIYIKGAIYNE